MQVETPPGSNLAYTKMKTEEAARLARSHADLTEYTFATVGGSDAGQQPGGAIGSADLGSVYVRMVPKKDRSVSQDDFGERLRKEAKQIGGADVSVFTSGFGGARKQIQVELRGTDAWCSTGSPTP